MGRGYLYGSIGFHNINTVALGMSLCRLIMRQANPSQSEYENMIEVNINFPSLLHLLQASSKDIINKLCLAAFVYRHAPNFPKNVIETTSSDLKLESNDSIKVLQSLQTLIGTILFNGYTDAADIAKLFPVDFHKNLRDLLIKIILDHLPSWRSSTIDNLVSFPRLANFNWRVDVKTASSSLPRMAVPTCLMQLQIENSTKQQGLDSVTVELSRETLDTMLDGLGRIRDQLSAVAKSS